jgi:hypothetical protein
VTGLAASVALATTTTSGSTAETGTTTTASSGSSRAGRGNVTFLTARVASLSSGSGALVVSLGSQGD